jgi:hypothetical protein
MTKSINDGFENLKEQVNSNIFTHPIIRKNKYCEWFAKGNMSKENAIDFTVQFSVFSNHFLIAQLMKVINAQSTEEARAGKEILCNELGVIFSSKETENKMADTDLVGITGTVNNSTYKFEAAHFEWLVNFAEPLGLKYEDLGKSQFALPSTSFFCEELKRLYGSADPQTALGASFAVENWAASGFWKQLITGFEKFNIETDMNLKLFFFKWHDALEAQHAQHTWTELEEVYFSSPDFDTDLFIDSAVEMLEGVSSFFNGLDEQRSSRVS